MGQHADDLIEWTIRQQMEYDPFFDDPTWKMSKHKPRWNTIKGQTLYVEDMETSHIINSIKKLTRDGRPTYQPLHDELANRGIQFIYCCACQADVPANLITGKQVYPNRLDLYDLPFWQCPNCNNSVGCHHKTDNPTKPLGVIPTPKLKHARNVLHSLIDPIWQNNIIRKHKLYALISEELRYEYHTAELRTLEEAVKVYNKVIELINWQLSIRANKNKPRYKILENILAQEQQRLLTKDT